MIACEGAKERLILNQAYLPDVDGELRSLYKTRTVQEGEVLTLVGQFNFKVRAINAPKIT